MRGGYSGAGRVLLPGWSAATLIPGGALVVGNVGGLCVVPYEGGSESGFWVVVGARG